MVQRYLRLTPAFATTMLFYANVAPFIGSGPFFPKFQQSVFRRCDQYWWTGLLYLHNFVPWDSDKVCMGWSWFLGNDFIFFAVSTLALLVFYRSRALGWALVWLLALTSFAITLWCVGCQSPPLSSTDVHDVCVTCDASSDGLIGVTQRRRLCIQHRLGTYIFDHHYEEYSYWAYRRANKQGDDLSLACL